MAPDRKQATGRSTRPGAARRTKKKTAAPRPASRRAESRAQRQTVRQYMSAHPHSIGQNQTLATAHRIMREHRIRHLPVLDGDKLVGVVSDRDLHLVETLKDVDPETVPVEEAMTPDPYTVSPAAGLEGVVRRMAERRYGSVVVVDRGRVVGVFTATDGLHALGALLEASRNGR